MNFSDCIHFLKTFSTQNCSWSQSVCKPCYYLIQIFALIVKKVF